MIGLDTNVVVRYLVQDEPDQSAAASTVIDALSEKAPGFLSLVTVVELHWVLRRAYKISTARCAALVEGLLNARELRVDQDSIVRAALTESRDGIDFADAVIAELGRVSGCEHTVTFDRRAAQSDEMRLLEPRTSTG
ncbi:MAG: type II toxin-antitoxin system VapC family toxin [Actinomycetota bacterium]|nr:type II toxin-antitoxin system VapC family toxin [Actinomycetota bacterium]